MSFSREGPLGNFCSEGTDSEGRLWTEPCLVVVGRGKFPLSICVRPLYILILLSHVETMWKGFCTLPQAPSFLSRMWLFPYSPLSLFPCSFLLSHHLLCMFQVGNPWVEVQWGDAFSGIFPPSGPRLFWCVKLCNSGQNNICSET